jgi:hypothetical protein
VQTHAAQDSGRQGILDWSRPEGGTWNNGSSAEMEKLATGGGSKGLAAEVVSPSVQSLTDASRKLSDLFDGRMDWEDMSRTSTTTNEIMRVLRKCIHQGR